MEYILQVEGQDEVKSKLNSINNFESVVDLLAYTLSKLSAIYIWELEELATKLFLDFQTKKTDSPSKKKRLAAAYKEVLISFYTDFYENESQDTAFDTVFKFAFKYKVLAREDIESFAKRIEYYQ